MQSKPMPEAKVVAVMVGRQPDSLVTTRQPEVRVTFAGFEGDRHAGITMRSDGRTPFYPRGTEIRNLRQVSLVSIEELAEIAALMRLPGIEPEWLGANLALVGLERLTYLPPFTRLFFAADAVLVVVGENLPCLVAGRVIQSHYPDQPGLAEQFTKAALHRRGVTAWVERPGIIRAGEAVGIRIPEVPICYRV